MQRGFGRRTAAVSAGALVALALGWFVLNPPGRFGMCHFGVTVYNVRPYVLCDLQIRPNGEVRTVAKTHDVTPDTLAWLLETDPDVLIVATGWDGVCKVAEPVASLPNVTVHVLSTGEARKRYNRLKAAGRRVAIHYHATC